LRYDLLLNSEEEDIVDFETSIDLTHILKAGNILETGLGEIHEGVLRFPSIDKSAPCTHKFTFFVRINQHCGNMDLLPVLWENLEKNVTLYCGLTPTGPDSWGMFAFGIFAIVVIFFSWKFLQKKSA
jgi:hypothetical protein